jgi:hypothetical protein
MKHRNLAHINITVGYKTDGVVEDAQFEYVPGPDGTNVIRVSFGFLLDDHPEWTCFPPIGTLEVGDYGTIGPYRMRVVEIDNHHLCFFCEVEGLEISNY